MSTAAEPGHKHRGYRATKASNVKWLGDVPQHWDVLRLKYTAELVNEKVNGVDSELAYTGLEHVESGTGKRLAIEAEASSDGQASIHRAGDVLFCKLRPYLAKVYAAENDGICTSELLVLRPKILLQHYLRDYLLNQSFISVVDSSTYGAKMPRASWDFIGSLPVLVPPLDEQRTIVRFLDRETARIDVLIGKKHRQIELLHRKRAALISHAVTKGLDPKAPLKDSGIHWLGPIPEHWTIRRFRFDLRSIEQGWSPQCDNCPAELNEWGVLKVGCVNGIEFDESEHKRLPDDLEPIPEYEIRPGDILMSRANTTELLGSAVLVRVVRPRLMLSDKLYRMRVHPTSLDPEFLVFAFGSHASRYQFERDATGASASMKNIGQDTIKALLLPRPPITEQRDIVRVLKVRAERTRRAIGRIEASIDRLREFRTALISAAVTGKIDVRKEVA